MSITINKVDDITQKVKRNKNIQQENDENEKVKSMQINIKNRYSWLLVFSVSTVITVSSFIIIFNVVSGNKFSIDVAIVLSTLLAFFSIFLSSFFYFKATDQSNQFYDRSYTHTRDIANTLAKMEGKFGEALKNIEGYSNRLNERFDNLPLINSNLQKNVLEEIETNITELRKKIEEGNISAEEIKKFEDKFSDIQNENKELNKKLKNNPKYRLKDNKVNNFLLSLINKYEPNYIRNINMTTLSEIVRNELISYSDFDDEFITEFVTKGIINSDLTLTNKGVEIISVIATTNFS